MSFHILNVSVRQKLMAIKKFEIYENLLKKSKNEHTAEISEQNFDGLAYT